MTTTNNTPGRFDQSAPIFDTTMVHRIARRLNCSSYADWIQSKLGELASWNEINMYLYERGLVPARILQVLCALRAECQV